MLVESYLLDRQYEPTIKEVLLETKSYPNNHEAFYWSPQVLEMAGQTENDSYWYRQAIEARLSSFLA